MAQDLTKVESHFAFGENWSSYANTITNDEIEAAKKNLVRLLGADSLSGHRFLDVGCGSGIHSLAALQLGADEVVAVDLDPRSVETTEHLLRRFASQGANYRVSRQSVFDLDPAEMGTFDVAYSWGILHHTGDMYAALERTSELTAPHGLFAFALYRKTWLCPFWKWEKQWYAGASTASQARARALYVGLFKMGLRATGRNYAEYLRSYKSNRGMDFHHDVHDWLDGFPYESITEREVACFMTPRGFVLEKQCVIGRLKVLGREVGMFGSGCDEYVYRRNREKG